MTLGRLSRMTVLMGVVLLAACESTATPPVATDAPQAGIVVGCATVEAGDCQAATARILSGLPPGRGAPFDIQISLGACPNDAPCPATIAARGGIAFVEYAGGPDSLTYSLGGVPWLLGPLDNGFTDPIAPSSRRVAGAGPFPFELGHCGLSHVVDFDGSYWVLVGQFDGEASGVINGESGELRLLAPNLAVYTGPAAFTARLVRFPGAKRFWNCA
jgi:hypothetical protein